MDRIGRPWRLQGKMAADHLKMVPLMRGWGGNHEGEDWMMVGSGRKLKAVAAYEKKISGDSDREMEAQWNN